MKGCKQAQDRLGRSYPHGLDMHSWNMINGSKKCMISATQEAERTGVLSEIVLLNICVSL